MSLINTFKSQRFFLENPLKKDNFPEIIEEVFNFKEISNGFNIVYFNIIAQISKKPKSFFNNEWGYLSFGFEDKSSLVIDKLAEGHPALGDVFAELKQRGMTIKDFYKFFYRIQDTNMLSEEEKSFLVRDDLNSSTKIIRFKLPSMKKMHIEELYLIEDVGGQDHILAFMKDTNYPSSVPLIQNDVVNNIIITGDKSMTRQLLHSIRIGNDY